MASPSEPARAPRRRPHPFANVDFDRAPFPVIWETTQACDLACRHCRAEARPQRHPGELTTAAAKRLLDDVRRLRPIIFVFMNDGDGFTFVSHTGEIFPTGFLPVSAGNVRRDDLVEVYRTGPLFRALRDCSSFKGKCGVCEYLPVCGGSRARACAVTDDWLDAEPFCAHVARRWQRMADAGEAERGAEHFARRATRQGFALPVFDAAPARAA